MRIFVLFIMTMVLVNGQTGFINEHEVLKRNFLRNLLNEFKLNDWYSNESHKKRIAASSNDDYQKKKHGTYSIPCLMNVISCYSHGK